MPNVITLNDENVGEEFKLVRSNAPTLRARCERLNIASGALFPFELDDFPVQPAVLFDYSSDTPLADISGNGLDLSIQAGGVFITDIVPGYRALYCDLGCRLGNATPGPAPLLQYGDLTIFTIGMFDFLPSQSSLIAFGGTSDLETQNHLWMQRVPNNNLARNMEWFHEHGAGINDSFATPLVGALAPSLPPVHVPYLITSVRRVDGANCFVQHYSGPLPFFSEIGPLPVPTGGTLATLQVTTASSVDTNPNRQLLFSQAVVPYAATASDVLTIYNAKMGGLYGLFTP